MTVQMESERDGDSGGSFQKKQRRIGREALPKTTNFFRKEKKKRLLEVDKESGAAEGSGVEGVAGAAGLEGCETHRRASGRSGRSVSERSQSWPVTAI